jgi:hypothetical protein
LAHPDASLQQLTHTAAELGLTISPQGLDQRFTTPAATLLERVFADATRQVVNADTSLDSVVDHFSEVLLLDATTITLPDGVRDDWLSCGGRTATTPRSAVKLTVRLDLGSGHLEGPELSAGRTQDKATELQQAPVQEGGLRIADLGYWGLTRMRELTEAGSYVLSRLHVQTIVADAETGARLDLPEWLRAHPETPLDHRVTLGTTERLPARLIAIRVAPEIAEQRRRTIRARAKREGETPSQRLLERADWDLIVTTAPAKLLTLAEAVALLRARWQIELLFKLWKQHGHLADWRSTDSHRIHCELYAKLIALLIQHWLLLTGGWHHADRSLVRLAECIREHGILLASALGHPRLLRAVLTRLIAVLDRCHGLERRRGHPSTAQLLADPSLLGLG